jgi:hypothetical protein
MTDLMREDSFLGSWRLSSVKQTLNNEEAELEEFKKACASTYLPNIDMMNS